MPSPSEIDSSEIRATLISWIRLLDVIEDGVLRDYFYRFAFISNENSSVAIRLESLRVTFLGRKTEGSCWQH